MTEEKLNRANYIFKGMFNKIKLLENIETENKATLGNAIFELFRGDIVIATKIKELLAESKDRFQKEFESL